jgi:toxin ParE1/3/4
VKLVYTEPALESLQEILDFFPPDVPETTVNKIRERILDKADKLIGNPYLGQIEIHLLHLGLSHRRLIEGNYKIVYRVQNDLIFITDIFDSRQDPDKMKG